MIRRFAPLSLAGAALLAVAGAGCSPMLGGVSSAPPGLVLRHEHNAFDDDIVTLSPGTAYAIDCWDAWTGEACTNVVTATGDAKIAQIYPSHLERRADWYGEMRSIPSRPGFVIAAVSPGETFITVTGSGGETRVKVVVE